MSSRHIVSQGECLSSIATKYKFNDWHLVYDDPANADFRKKRPNPNVIFPGDQIVIPDKKKKEELCATGKVHQFKLPGTKTLFRVVLKDPHGKPYAGKNYKLTIKRTDPLEGVTGADGLVEKWIPVDASEGELTFWPSGPDASPITWPLEIGHLDPHDEISGTQARLNNLGFNCGPNNGVDGPRTRAAIRAFQKKYGMQVDGIVGPATQQKLLELHGS